VGKSRDAMAFVIVLNPDALVGVVVGEGHEWRFPT
jgi:hypothetical protein